MVKDGLFYIYVVLSLRFSQQHVVFGFVLTAVPELNYISQVVIMMYEDPTKVSVMFL